MKIGISITSSYEVNDVRFGARQMVARARAANEAGLDSLFVGDHHVVPIPYYQNTPIMGRLIAEWDQRPCGALFLLPLWHPVLAAEQIATLASIAEGPFIMQCGLGAGDYQFNAMGANIKHRTSAFEQSLECLRALWRGETVSLDGRWKFKDAKISPLPPEPVSVWIGASAPVAIDRAARLGDVWLAEPGITLEETKKTMDHYQDALVKHQRSVNTIAIRRDIYVAESKKDANETLEILQSKGYRGFDTQALMIGDFHSIAEQMQKFEALGFTDIIIRNLHGDPQKAVESTERLGKVKVLLDNFIS